MEEKDRFAAYIEERAIKNRGIITDWEFSVDKLIEAITNKSGILRIDRMGRKRWDDINNKLVEEYTDKLIITIEGNQKRK